ncbi:DMT family transporter [Roseomonas terrae]|jgi:drug/metabolite transporter (DMT)-like permease|uniref:DMT family transporter n=1 Tax=Neoroseomonas terrae TaxID=424799 RepID=A0ABS5EG88_9PROT|nr:DMT family transporter [Neoroseomonas terrae]MBR0650038.1 DMT family transporter [Neoroseomonas terrae]
MSALAWSLLLLLSVLWGGSFFFVGIAVTALPPFTIVAVRVGLAAVVLWAALPALGVAPPRGARAWRAIVVMAMLNNAIPFSLIVWAQQSLPSGLAAILNATTPLWGVLVAHVATREERITAPRLAGAVLGFAGVAAMSGMDLLSGTTASLPATVAMLLATFSYACAGVYGRRLGRVGVAPMQAALGQLTAATLMMVPLALAIEAPWERPMPPAAVLAALGGLAVFCTAIAYVLYFRILALAGAVNLLLVTFLVPVSAILLGTLVLGERLAVQHLIGMALIGAGLVLIDGRLAARLRRG